VEQLLDHRFLNIEVPYTFTPEAQSVLNGFADEIEAGFPGVPVSLIPHLAWLPELCERVAVILWILRSRDSPVDAAAAAVDDAVVVAKWLGRQHLRNLLSGHPIADGAAGADHADAAAEMLHKIRQKGPLTRRQLYRSYDKARGDWFFPVLESLLDAGKAVYVDGGRLVASDSPFAGSGDSAKSTDSPPQISGDADR
jgi:hypothetical protein